MKEIMLLLSDEDVSKIISQAMFEGNCANVNIQIKEMSFSESSATIMCMKGELK